MCSTLIKLLNVRGYAACTGYFRVLDTKNAYLESNSFFLLSQRLVKGQVFICLLPPEKKYLSFIRLQVIVPAFQPTISGRQNCLCLLLA